MRPGVTILFSIILGFGVIGLAAIVLVTPRPAILSAPVETVIRVHEPGLALATYEGYIQVQSGFFHEVSPLGDIDGDGRDEFLAANTDEIIYRNREQLFAAGTIRALRYDPRAPRYIRGDTDGDGSVTLADAVAIARLAVDHYCFSGDPLPPNLPACPAAYDVNANGCIDRQDAIFLATYLFKPFQFAPAPPFPGCGQHYRLEVAEDLSFRHLPCLDSGSCRQ